MHQDIPKQFIHIENKPLIIYTMEVFEKHPAIDAMIVVTLLDWMGILEAYAKQFNITKLHWICEGGSTNQESIKNGLKVLSENCDPNDVVLVHDGNRCLVTSEIISSSLATFQKHGSAVAAIPCVEVAFYSNDNGISANQSLPREKLFRTQTPHTYTLQKLLWAHGEAEKRGITNTAATCVLMEQLGETVFFSRGSEENLKITTVEDIKIFKSFLNTKEERWLK